MLNRIKKPIDKIYPKDYIKDYKKKISKIKMKEKTTSAKKHRIRETVKQEKIVKDNNYRVRSRRTRKT